MDYFSDTVRTILVIGGGALAIFSVVLMIQVYEAATEAKEWFARENRKYLGEE